MNKPVVLANGEWALLISLWTREFLHPAMQNRFHEIDDWRMVNLLVSADQGKSWNWRGKVGADNRQFDEPVMIEQNDATLQMLIRTTYGLARSFSADGGRNRSTPASSSIPHTNSRIVFKRLASGRVLLVKHGGFADADRVPGRSHLRAWPSDDEGETWYGGLLLDERGSISYPDGFQSPDGRIYMAYDRERSAERALYLAVFTEEDIIAGCEVSGRCRLKYLISKERG